MTAQAWITLAIVGLILFALVRNLAPPDIVFLGATTLLALMKIIDVGEAVSGFSNPGMLTVAALFVVAAALRETGVLDYLGHHLLGKVKSGNEAMLRIAGLSVPISSFLNNTPIVAMLMPVVIDWCRKRNYSPSQFLIPLSYFTILGGTCTLIGTSTNLVTQGLLIDAYNDTAITDGLSPEQAVLFREGLRPLGFFEIGQAGVPYAIIGTLYIFLLGRRFLPRRKELLEQLGESRREYLVEMIVQPECRLVGLSVEQAGLRQLAGLFLIEIDRNGRIIAPVGPDERIHANDRLVFTGVVSYIVELEKIPGLVPAADAAYEVRPVQQRGRRLTEAVISPSSPLVGKDIRNANFRSMYNAAVVAVHRSGHRVTNKIGDIVLRSGDTLLLQTGPNFSQAHKNNPDFHLVSDVEGFRPLRHDRAWVAVVTFAAMVVAMTLKIEPMIASFTAAGLMLITRCISVSDARQSVDWQVLVTIGAAFGVGAALENTGAAASIARSFVGLTQGWALPATIAVFYLVCMLITSMITNNALVVLMFPFCVEMAKFLEISPRPLVIAMILAASADFSTPIGYQTNMMIYGPGGYRFVDFVRVGVPLSLILWVVATALIPMIWA